MRLSRLLAPLALGVLAAGCSPAYGGFPRILGPLGDVVVVDDEREEEGRGGRTLGVPRGHYPPPGECRIWYPGRPAGQQPPPAKCDRLAGRVPYGAFILFNGREWDTRYDWEDHERRNRGSVPGVILDLVRSLRQ